MSFALLVASCAAAILALWVMNVVAGIDMTALLVALGIGCVIGIPGGIFAVIVWRHVNRLGRIARGALVGAASTLGGAGFALWSFAMYGIIADQAVLIALPAAFSFVGVGALAAALPAASAVAE